VVASEAAKMGHDFQTIFVLVEGCNSNPKALPSMEIKTRSFKTVSQANQSCNDYSAIP
jgi:hypothetical protein